MMREQWYRVLKDKEYCSDILGIFGDLHDYTITRIDFKYDECIALVYLRFDTDDEGVVLKFYKVKRLNICPKEYEEDRWLSGASIQITNEGYFLWYDTDEKCSDDEIIQSQNLNWIEAEEIIFAWLDKDNNIIPLTDEMINPVLKVLNYNTGQYEKKQKHFKVYEV